MNHLISKPKPTRRMSELSRRHPQGPAITKIPDSFVHGPVDGAIFRPLKPHTDSRGWLIEVFREDEMIDANLPAMGYVSETKAGVIRGPHEHSWQSDFFVFMGPGDFEFYLWDIRSSSPTWGRKLKVLVGESNRQSVIVPPGVVHAYKNISDHAGWVMNFPNRLYAGEGYQDPIDEVRYENQPDSPFQID